MGIVLVGAPALIRLLTVGRTRLLLAVLRGATPTARRVVPGLGRPTGPPAFALAAQAVRRPAAWSADRWAEPLRRLRLHPGRIGDYVTCALMSMTRLATPALPALFQG
ncbi:hypothetical protein ACFU6I_03660 [Streptomyces sp. NPDC057486]|uniref:hypothetical protein n=1 Tax=Streptomyces sp. NPDC057486 TaxID=3346145 RepID=UPI0036BD0CEE